MSIESRFINPYTDYGFKRLFGTEANKALLIDFLNQLLPAKHQITDLQYAPNEHIGINEIDRKAVFDVYCINRTGDRFIVELQKARQTYFKDRSVFYASFPIQEQAQTGNWNFRLAAVYTVAILNFRLSDAESSPEVVSVVQLKDQHGRVFYDKLTFIYMEMPKFTKSVDELETQADRWQYVFNNLETLQEQPPQVKGSVFDRLFNEAELAKMSKAERESYERSLRTYRDLSNTLEAAELKGLEEGIEQGYQQGIEQGIKRGIEQGMQQGIEQGAQQQTIQIARKALGMGRSIADIAELTGLTEVEVQALLNR